MLTELGHGLDIHSMETTATLLPSNEFDLHSPAPSSAKYVYTDIYFPFLLLMNSV